MDYKKSNYLNMLIICILILLGFAIFGNSLSGFISRTVNDVLNRIEISYLSSRIVSIINSIVGLFFIFFLVKYLELYNKSNIASMIIFACVIKLFLSIFNHIPFYFLLLSNYNYDIIRIVNPISALLLGVNIIFMIIELILLFIFIQNTTLKHKNFLYTYLITGCINIFISIFFLNIDLVNSVRRLFPMEIFYYIQIYLPNVFTFVGLLAVLIFAIKHKKELTHISY